MSSLSSSLIPLVGKMMMTTTTKEEEDDPVVSAVRVGDGLSAVETILSTTSQLDQFLHNWLRCHGAFVH
jgi:hypothetical protein